MKVLKVFYLILIMIISIPSVGQNLQLLYDFRGAIDSELHEKNYPSLSFEYFTEIDSIGSFLFKLNTDFNGDNSNIGQTFVQVSQSVKFWRPKIYISANYSGGLGVSGASFGYYLTNAFGLGVSHPFQWKGAWLNANIQYRYTAFNLPSHDVQGTFYFGKGFFHYKMFISGNIVAWTENRNQGSAFTDHLQGKKFAFFGDIQIWHKVIYDFFIGSKVNLYYNLLGVENAFQVYPTIGLQYKFSK